MTSNRYNKDGASAAYTANVKRPSGTSGISARGIAGLVLTVLLPPVGLLYLWSKGVFRTRGRMVLTTLATVEMMALCVLLTPHQELTAQLPVPAAPVSVTTAPEDDSLDALYNIEQLLYEQQLAKVVEKGGTERDLLTEEQKLEAASVEKEDILNTTVYCVFNNAKYYHILKVCGNQTNGRELTVREAMGEALAPCPNCNPPYITG